jgi:hypothetical protein
MSDRHHESAEHEIRKVRMADPGLSEQTNRAITRDLQVAVGATSVDVPVDRLRVDRGAEAPLPSGHLRGGTDSRLLIIVIGSMFIGVAAIVAVGAGHGWIVAVAFVLVAGLALFVVRTVLAMTRVREHPSATTAAAMQADGIRSPDEFFSAAVAEFTDTREDDLGGHRDTPVHDDPAQAAAEQETAMTPSSGPSEAVGP